MSTTLRAKQYRAIQQAAQDRRRDGGVDQRPPEVRWAAAVPGQRHGYGTDKLAPAQSESSTSSMTASRRIGTAARAHGSSRVGPPRKQSAPRVRDGTQLQLPDLPMTDRLTHQRRGE